MFSSCLHFCIVHTAVTRLSCFATVIDSLWWVKRSVSVVAFLYSIQDVPLLNPFGLLHTAIEKCARACFKGMSTRYQSARIGSVKQVMHALLKSRTVCIILFSPEMRLASKPLNIWHSVYYTNHDCILNGLGSSWSHVWDMLYWICIHVFPLGMHPVWDHVREGEEGSAHGQELVLWGRECLHHPFGGCKSLFDTTAILQISTDTKIVFWFAHSCSSVSAFLAALLSPWERAATGTWTSFPNF